MRKLRENAGFSLVELMVVVGIIGVLTTLAIPNYTKFANKAKQSEAKSQLAAIYTVEKAYQVEASTFTACLSDIGYVAEGSNRRYGVGFSGTITALTSPTGTNCTVSANKTYFLPASGVAVADFPTTSAETGTFTAGAAGSIGGSQKDKWTIDQSQTLANPTSGI